MQDEGLELHVNTEFLKDLVDTNHELDGNGIDMTAHQSNRI